MVGSKLTCPNWTLGQEKPYEGFVLPKFLVKKVGISCSYCFQDFQGNICACDFWKQ
jgi:hypothetical protein